MVKMNLNEMAVGYTSAILAVVMMLALGILGNLGIYMSGVNAMMQWHIYFRLILLECSQEWLRPPHFALQSAIFSHGYTTN